MTILGIFRKAVDIAGKVEPVVGAVNPGAGLFLSAILQGIYAIQAILPGAEHNEAKKAIVTQIANASAVQAGIALGPDQISLLIENMLFALQNAANGQHPPVSITSPVK